MTAKEYVDFALTHKNMVYCPYCEHWYEKDKFYLENGYYKDQFFCCNDNATEQNGALELINMLSKVK